MKIKNKEGYNGQIGKIKRYDGHIFYEIELKSIKKTIDCLESEIEKISTKVDEIYYKLFNVMRIKLKDQDEPILI